MEGKWWGDKKTSEERDDRVGLIKTCYMLVWNAQTTKRQVYKFLNMQYVEKSNKKSVTGLGISWSQY